MDLAAEEGAVTVIPIRHPKVVAKLWEESREELIPDFFQMWGAIQLFKGLENVYYLPMDVDDVQAKAAEIGSKAGLRVNSGLRLSELDKSIMSVRAFDVEYAELAHGDAVQDLVDDLEEFLGEIYEGASLEAPSKQDKEKKRKAGKARVPKNKWKHVCPVAKDVVLTAKGEICPECGGQE